MTKQELRLLLAQTYIQQKKAARSNADVVRLTATQRQQLATPQRAAWRNTYWWIGTPA